MEITLTIKGANTTEIRDAIRELYANGISGEAMDNQTIEIAPGEMEGTLFHLPENKREKVRRRHHKKHHYCKEEDDFLKSLRNNGVDIPAITRAFNTRYNLSVSNDAVQKRLSRI